MKSYNVTFTCPRCGADLERVTSSIVTATAGSAIARCTECRNVTVNAWRCSRRCRWG